jgi:uncharacterized protein
MGKAPAFKASTTPRKIRIDAATSVSALLDGSVQAATCFVFAHGAGAGMDHAFMRSVAEGLATRGIATLRYQFLYMERGSKRPDAPAVAHAAVRAAVAHAREAFPKATLIAGGKSFGGRMTSQAQALDPLDGVKGLAFFGFPLHSAGRPSIERAAHLSEIELPMLFLQGDKDKLAELPLLRSVVSKLGGRACLKLFKDADHSFHVPVRSGRTDAEVMGELLDAFTEWMECWPLG